MEPRVELADQLRPAVHLLINEQKSLRLSIDIEAQADAVVNVQVILSGDDPVDLVIADLEKPLRLAPANPSPPLLPAGKAAWLEPD